jgi:hypothetical protein
MENFYSRDALEYGNVHLHMERGRYNVRAKIG